MATQAVAQSTEQAAPFLHALDNEPVNQELSRILSSQTFRRAPSLRHMLEYAVSMALTSGNVTERLIARHVLDADEEFDPALDPSVRVQYGRLRKRLHAYYEGEGEGNPLRILIPERSYTPIFEPHEFGGPDLELRTKFAIPTSQATPRKPALAVLPFLNLTNNADKDVLCASITEDLISALAAVPSVDVVARSSAFQFKDEPVDVRTVGRELGVDLVLEGSVKSENEGLRVTAQLAKTRDGFALWAESYTYDAGVESTLPLKDVVSDIVKTLPLKDDEAGD